MKVIYDRVQPLVMVYTASCLLAQLGQFNLPLLCMGLRTAGGLCAAPLSVHLTCWSLVPSPVWLPVACHADVSHMPPAVASPLWFASSVLGVVGSAAHKVACLRVVPYIGVQFCELQLLSACEPHPC